MPPTTPTPANAAAVSEPSAIARLALRAAVNQLGQAEVPLGSNRGPMVDKYLAAVGLKPGLSWCQAFVYWCYGEAARQECQANPVFKTGGVLACWNNTPAGRRISRKDAAVKPGLVAPGAQGFMDFGGGLGHTFLVEAIGADGTLYTIEGNSNNDGSRNGTQVVRHRRKLGDTLIKGFVNY